MTTKLTLTLDDAVIKKAKIWAENQNTSLSRAVEGYFRRITENITVPSAAPDLPPITQKLLGIAAGEGLEEKSDKKLLLEALEEKFL